MSNTPQAAQGQTDPGGRSRLNTFWWVLLWVSVIVLAVVPIPW